MRIVRSVIVPGALVVGHRRAVDRRDVARRRRCRRRTGRPPAATGLCPQRSALTVGSQPAAREEREHGEHALVDQARGDVATAAPVDRDPGVGQYGALQLRTSKAGTRRCGRAEQRVLRLGALRVQSRLQLCPVGEDRARGRRCWGRLRAGPRSGGARSARSGVTATEPSTVPARDDRAAPQLAESSTRVPGAPSRQRRRRRPRVRPGCRGARTGGSCPWPRRPPSAPSGEGCLAGVPGPAAAACCAR